MSNTRIGIFASVVLALASASAQAQHAHHTTASMTAADSVLAGEIEAVRRATERYLDHANAVQDGYKLFGAEGPLMGEHWYHPALVKQSLDLTRPATLQYALIKGRRELVGVAFNAYQRSSDPVPAGFHGQADAWHVHDMKGITNALLQDRPVARWLVNRSFDRGKVGGGKDRTHLAMVHAWVWVENPSGLFAQEHRVLPYLRADLPAEWADGADLDAAWGVALLDDRTCDYELSRLARLARLEASQAKALESVCASAETAARTARASARSAAELNGAASVAWRSYTAARDRTLTAEQKRRLELVVEHPAMGHG